LPI
ncbi:Macrodomain Ter protein, partial [Haemophilus influenzae]|jgi:hypothetical protein